jgi:hypothetical protein
MWIKEKNNLVYNNYTTAYIARDINSVGVMVNYVAGAEGKRGNALGVGGDLLRGCALLCYSHGRSFISGIE